MIRTSSKRHALVWLTPCSHIWAIDIRLCSNILSSQATLDFCFETLIVLDTELQAVYHGVHTHTFFLITATSRTFLNLSNNSTSSNIKPHNVPGPERLTKGTNVLAPYTTILYGHYDTITFRHIFSLTS